MKILDRYISKEFIGPFLFGLIAFTSIIAGSLILTQVMGEAAKYGIPPLKAAQWMIYQIPAVITLTLPMATLLATMLAFSRLSSDLEIVALRSGGVGILRVAVPVIVIGLLISLFTIWFNEAIVPKASQSAEKIFRTYRHDENPTIKENINLTEYGAKGLPLRTINVAEVTEGVLKNITVAEYEEGKLVRIVQSESGRWLREGGWQFYNGIMHNFSFEDNKKVVVIEFEKETINIQLNPYDFSQREKKVEEMNIRELKERIERKQRTGEAVTGDQLKFHMKFSIPFASLIFSILGISVGLRPHRSSSATGIGLSLLIIIVYYFLIGLSNNMTHFVPPILAAWLPNLIIGATSLILLRRVALQ